MLATTTTFVQAAIKHDLEQAAQWLESLIALSPMALASAQGQNALLRLDLLDHEKARPLLEGMLKHCDECVSAIAAALIMVRSFEGDVWEAEREAILQGGPEWWAAHIAAQRFDGNSADTALDAT